MNYQRLIPDQAHKFFRNIVPTAQLIADFKNLFFAVDFKIDNKYQIGPSKFF
jgi:hypothetical protein